MLRGLRRRLDRLWAAHQQRVARRDAERARQAHREAFAATLRAGLAHAGIDPDTVPAMRRVAAPDPVAPAAAASRPPPGDPVGRLCAHLARIARRCREHPLDLAVATPIELFAVYCFAAEG